MRVLIDVELYHMEKVFLEHGAVCHKFDPEAASKFAGFTNINS
jgi:hypothetical protein